MTLNRIIWKVNPDIKLVCAPGVSSDEETTVSSNTSPLANTNDLSASPAVTAPASAPASALASPAGGAAAEPQVVALTVRENADGSVTTATAEEGMAVAGTTPAGTATPAGMVVQSPEERQRIQESNFAALKSMLIREESKVAFEKNHNDRELHQHALLTQETNKLIYKLAKILPRRREEIFG